VKEKYNFKEIPKVKDEFFKVIDSTLAEATWTKDKADNLNKPMFTLGEKTYTQQNLSDFIASHQSKKAEHRCAFCSIICTTTINQSFDYKSPRN
jgi:hypothetical protein